MSCLTGTFDERQCPPNFFLGDLLDERFCVGEDLCLVVGDRFGFDLRLAGERFILL